MIYKELLEKYKSKGIVKEISKKNIITCYDRKTMQKYLYDLINVERDSKIRFENPFMREPLFLLNSNGGIIEMTAPLMAIYLLKDCDLSVRFVKKGFRVNLYKEKSCISLGTLLVFMGDKISEKTIWVLYEKALLERTGGLGIITFNSDIMHNRLFGITDKGMKDINNLNAYCHIINNLKKLNNKCQDLFLDMFRSEEDYHIEYFYIPGEMKRVFKTLKNTLLDISKNESFGPQDVTRCFLFLDMEENIIPFLSKEKFDPFINMYKEWVDGFMEDYYKYYDVDSISKAHYFIASSYNIASFVGVLRKKGVSTEKKQQVIDAVLPVIDLIHQIFDTKEKQYELWANLNSINYFSYRLFWMFKNAYHFKIELDLSNENVRRVLDVVFDSRTDCIIESIEDVYKCYSTPSDKDTIQAIAEKIFKRKNVELLQMALRKELIPVWFYDNVIDWYTKTTPESEQVELLPCLMAFKACRAMGIGGI